MSNVITIHVKRTSVEKTGTARGTGKPWTRYRIEDYDLITGARPTHDLLTFEDLPTSGPIEVELEPFPKTGGNLRHYTVRQVKSNGKSSSKGEVTRAEFDSLRRQVNALQALYEDLPANTTRP